MERVLNILAARRAALIEEQTAANARRETAEAELATARADCDDRDKLLAEIETAISVLVQAG